MFRRKHTTTVPAVPAAPAAPAALEEASSKAAHKMRRRLQKALNRPVILPSDGKIDAALRAVRQNQAAGIALAALGTSIAAVVTGGLVLGRSRSLRRAFLPSVSRHSSASGRRSTRSSRSL
jgi:hypothetical protein